jgi:hypothetical protein
MEKQTSSFGIKKTQKMEKQGGKKKIRTNIIKETKIIILLAFRNFKK